jgi:hypothetical protein
MKDIEMTKIRLISNQNGDECNYGSERFRIANDGTVWVPAAAVGPLLAIGGFSLADEIPPVAVAHGSVRLVHRSDPTAVCSHAGITYAPEDGIITVPIEAAPDLACHGFAPLPGSVRNG